MIYYFDRYDQLYSAEKIEDGESYPNTGWRSPLWNPSKLLEKNKNYDFVFHGHVSNWNTLHAVRAIVKGECSLQCVFPTRGTEQLLREARPMRVYGECDSDTVKTCHCALVPCGKYKCCPCP